MISLQSLRKKDREEQAAQRQREIVLQQRQASHVSGWSLGASSSNVSQPEPEPKTRQGILKFAQFLYNS